MKLDGKLRSEIHNCVFSPSEKVSISENKNSDRTEIRGKKIITLDQEKKDVLSSNIRSWENSSSSIMDSFERPHRSKRKKPQVRKLKDNGEYINQKPRRIKPTFVVKTNEQHLADIRKIIDFSEKMRGKHVDIIEGFIYCISNPAWPEWVKIGETVDYESRLKTYQTSSPMTDYKMFLTWWVDDRKMIERKILNSLEASGFEVRGEWVKISQLELILFLNQSS